MTKTVTAKLSPEFYKFLVEYVNSSDNDFNMSSFIEVSIYFTLFTIVKNGKDFKEIFESIHHFPKFLNKILDLDLEDSKGKDILERILRMDDSDETIHDFKLFLDLAARDLKTLLYYNE